MEHAPHRVGEILKGVWKLLLEKKLPFLPTKVFNVRESTAALRFLSTGRHIGKIVVENDFKIGISPIEKGLSPRFNICSEKDGKDPDSTFAVNFVYSN